jgi:hypothetical protein
VHNGVGSSDHSLYAVTYGSGKAALFESHQSNSTPAVSIYKNQGTALQTTGDVKVNGKLYSEIGGTPRRATPIAYCTFTATETPEIVSSSGNVAVIWANDPFFPHWIATVTGETDASSWVVLSNLMMQYSHLSGGIFNLRTGTPQSPGVFKIAMQCVQNCDDSELYGNIYINFVIYKP